MMPTVVMLLMHRLNLTALKAVQVRFI